MSVVPFAGDGTRVLPSHVDSSSEQFQANRRAMLAQVSTMEEHLATARGGGGEVYIQRHRSRGRLLARERVELLLDADSPFLELLPLAGLDSEFHPGGSLVAGLGSISGTECLVVANDPTVRGGAQNPYTFRKLFRILEIARENRLPVVSLVESGGADLPSQLDLFIPAGRLFRDLTRLSAAGIPTIALVFGNSTAGGAYVPGMCDYVVMVKDQAKVFLGGPPLVKMATGEEADDEELGGAEMHARKSGLADYMAANELDCIRVGREIVARLNNRKRGPGPTLPADEPLYDSEEILGIVSSDLRIPFDALDILARVVDGSRFDEFKPPYGASLVTGWATVHGYPVGILANHRGVLFNAESEKAAQFIQLANQIDVPLIFFQNTTGFIVGKDYEQAGMVKDGAKMINAVANSSVPHITVMMGASYGAGNYGMCGRAFDPRFLFSWPNAKTAVMGGQQLAGVLSIVARQSAASTGREFDEEADARRREEVETQIEEESSAFKITSRLYDDGIIDPRDTRSVLGMCLSAIDRTEIHGTRGYGVFRM